MFRMCLFDETSKIVKFYDMEDINMEKLLCSLIVMSGCMEGIMYRNIEKRMKDKSKLYDSLELSSFFDIYSAIDFLFMDEYEFSRKTNVIVLEINKIYPQERGTFIYDLKTDIQ
jgi:hypothetical protein